MNLADPTCLGLQTILDVTLLAGLPRQPALYLQFQATARSAEWWVFQAPPVLRNGGQSFVPRLQLL